MGEWIEHDGTGCPVALNTHVQVRNRAGKIYCGRVGPEAFAGNRYNAFGILVGSAWLWAVNNAYPQEPSAIIAYRILDDNSEATTRKGRIEQFRKIADEGLKTAKPVKAPKKERADV